MPSRRLTRDQLAEFLPNHKAVRAFEQLFDDVNQTISAVEGSINSALGSGRAPNNRNLELRIDSLETERQRGFNPSEILKRLDNLEQQQKRSTNLSDILRRLDAIEAFVGI